MVYSAKLNGGSIRLLSSVLRTNNKREIKVIYKFMDFIAKP